MPEDFFDELLGKKQDELDDILDKIKNRWDTDLTRSLWDDTWMPPKTEERDNEEPPKRDLAQKPNRSRKNKQRYRNRK